MAMAPEQAGIGIRRHFTTEGVHPYDEVVWERRDARITNYRDGSVAFEQLGRRGAGRLVAERHQHPRPEVLPGHPRHARARVVAAPGRRPRRRHDHRVGHRGRLLRRRPRGRGVQRRAQAPDRHPEGGVQLAGVVQHRRQPACPSRRQRLLHPRRRRQDGLDPQLVRRGGHDLQGRLGLRHQPVEHPLVEGAAQGRRHRLGPGQLHAGRRRLGRHDQVGRQDPPRRQDGHPRRRPPRHRGVHLVQGHRGAQGPRAARRRLRHGPRRQGQPLDPVPERQQLGAGHRRVHAGRARRRRLAPPGRHRPARSSRPSGPATSCARSRQATWECADPGMQFDTTINRWHTAPTPAASTARTRAPSTCTSTTRRATWRQPQPPEVPATTTTRSTSRASRPPSRSCSPPRRSSSATPTTRPSPSPRRRAGSASWASATPTSAPCSWRWACPTTATPAGPGPAAITALMTGHAYATSARTAARMGPFAGFADNREHMLRVLDMHRRRRRHRRGARARRSCSAPPSRRGTTRSSSASSSACATARRRCSHPPAPSA